MPRSIILLVVLCVLPELVFLGSDYGLWGSTRWRTLAYQFGAFWAGLIHGWRPNYALQPYAMFFTYAFLHSGPTHLIVNMITLVSIGGAMVKRLGEWRFLLLYVFSILGGAAAFALLTKSPQPMVGASGALFGLAGGWVLCDVIDTMRETPGISTFLFAMLWPVVILILLNVIMYVSTGGLVAWETHLGGGLAGALITPILLLRRRTGG